MRLISTLSVLVPLLFSLYYFQKGKVNFLLPFLLVLIGSLVEVYSLIVHVYFEVPYTYYHHLIQLSAELVLIGTFSIISLHQKWLKYACFTLLMLILFSMCYEAFFKLDSGQFFSHSNIIRILFLMVVILLSMNEFLNNHQLRGFQNSVFIFYIANFFYLGFCVFAAIIRDAVVADMYKLKGTVFDLFSLMNTVYNLSLALAFYYSKWNK
jgi:hypothetical protein